MTIPPIKSASAPSAPFHSWRILVAEDSPVIQKLVLGQLQKLGHSADFVGDGSEAIALALATEYDLILMDCQMPGVDGYEATRQIRMSEARERHAPIIAVTAHVQQADREKCLEAGMDDYVTKPLRFSELIRIFEEFEIPFLSQTDSINVEVGGADSLIRLNPATIRSLNQLKILDEVVDLFLADTLKRLESLTSALAGNFATEARSSAHSIKGSSLIIGAEEFARIAGTIEDLIRKKKLAAARDLLPSLECEFKELRSALHMAVRNR